MKKSKVLKTYYFNFKAEIKGITIDYKNLPIILCQAHIELYYNWREEYTTNAFVCEMLAKVENKYYIENGVFINIADDNEMIYQMENQNYEILGDIRGDITHYGMQIKRNLK